MPPTVRLTGTHNPAANIVDSAATARRSEAHPITGALQRAIFNSANFSSIATDAEGVIQIFNVGAERMLGYAAAEVMNKITPADISDPEEVIARAKALTLELETPIAPGFEALVFKASRGIEDIYALTYIRKDGSRFPAVVSVTALRDGEGGIIGYLLIGTDNTARLQAEEARRASEARYRALFEYAPNGIVIADSESYYLDANPSICRMLGYSREELVGLHASDIVPAAEVEHIGAALGVIKDRADYQREWRFRRKDGSIFAAEVVATTMPDGRLLAVITDITERNRIDARLRRLVDSNAQGVLFWHAKGAIGTANDAFLQIVGYTREDLQAGRLDWAAMTPPGFSELDRHSMNQLESNGFCTPYEKEYLRKDGSRVAVMVGAATFDDNPDEGVCFVLDLTARKEIEDRQTKLDQRLRDLQFYTRSLIESNMDALMTTDPAGIISDVNKQMESLTGCTRDELIGAPFKNFFTDPARAEAGINRVLRHEKIANYELTARDREGRETVVSYNAVTLYDRERRLQGVFAAARDITERKQYEESLREVTHKAKQASRAKSEFLANMSHEIRTPMNAVIGLSHLLGKTGLNTEQAALLAKIKLASNSLTAVINDVLDLSKIEAGELILERAAFSPDRLLREVAAVMTVASDAKGIAFELDVPLGLPAALEGDAARLNQILSNLLSNAIKFTTHGGVKLSVRWSATESKGVTVSFAVHDTGIGIAPEMQSRLFVPFSQADTSITRRFGGTGLGLSIVKRLTNLMGGEVSLTSNAGVGSEFKVVLPFGFASTEALPEPGPSPAAAASDRHPLRGIRVLVVDDSEINLYVTKRTLELEGAQVWLCGDGQEAFLRLQADADAFDVVLMDVQMPVLDGHDATRRIRLELGLSHLPIIALTAGALSSERQRAKDAGMDDFIIKPFGAEALVRSILRHVATQVEIKDGGVSRRSAARAPEPGGEGGQASPEPASRPWPEIDGIDSVDARRRLGDDQNLFLSMLRRLLREFRDLALPAGTADRGVLATYAGRMHKLRGSAGMLGAKAIQQLASETEAASLAGERTRVLELATTLVMKLQRLAQHAGPALETVRTPDVDEEDVSGDALEPQILGGLIALLRQQSLSAVDRFAALSSQLERRLGERPYAELCLHMDNLQFAHALEVLESPAVGDKNPT